MVGIDLKNFTVKWNRITEKPNLAILDQQNTFSADNIFNGDVSINGAIYQAGELYETHVENLFSVNELIMLRDGATAPMAPGMYSGIQINMGELDNDIYLVSDRTGTMFVGEMNDLQPLSTRELTPINTAFGFWNNITNRYETNANATFAHVQNWHDAYSHALSSGNVHYLQIADIPNLSTELGNKTNLGHLHAIADITNLQTSLDSKLNKSGGVLTGDIWDKTNSFVILDADEGTLFYNGQDTDSRYLGINANADTATKLFTPRTIAGVSFDGTANITIASTNLSDGSNIAKLNTANTFTAISNTFLSTSSLVLNVESQSAATALPALITIKRANNSRGAGINFNNTNDSTVNWFIGQRYNGGNATTAFVINEDNGSMQSSGITRFYLEKLTGKIGVGTTAPLGSLDIAGNIPYLYIRDTQNKNWNSGDEVGGLIWYTNDISGIGAHITGFVKMIDDKGSGISTVSTAMIFGTANTNSNAVEAMRISSAGFVGIGTNTPTELLEVNGNIKAGSFIGNATSSTKLFTPRTIAGVSFDGMANIEIPFVNLSSKPTTLAGYGITDAALSTHNHFKTDATGLPSSTGAGTIDFSRINNYYSATAITNNVTWGASNIAADKGVIINVNPASYSVTLVQAGVTFQGAINGSGVVQGLSANKMNAIGLYPITANLILVGVNPAQA